MPSGNKKEVFGDSEGTVPAVSRAPFACEQRLLRFSFRLYLSQVHGRTAPNLKQLAPVGPDMTSH